MLQFDDVFTRPLEGNTRPVPRVRPRQATEEARKDQYYTHPDVAAWCMDLVHEHVGADAATWLEPSAGGGVFLDLLPRERRVGLDIEPKRSDIRRQDFLAWNGLTALAQPLVTVGNPPFGRNASLALRFLERAMLHSDAVCFILPRTFEKQTLQEKVPANFELVGTWPVRSNAFIHKDAAYDVPCCFQIWRRLPPGTTRTHTARHIDHPYFDIVGKDDDADFTFQRVGVNAGLASTDGLAKSWKSHHRIKAKEGVDWRVLMDDLNSLEEVWARLRSKTAGNPSIGKRELIEAYDTLLSERGKPAPRPSGPADDGNYALDLG